MKAIATIFTLLMFSLVGCAPPPDVDPITGGRIESQPSAEVIEVYRLGNGMYEWKYKDHWFIGYSSGGIIHAPYCECEKTND